MSLHQIPEHPHFRPGTVDRACWHEAIELNVYKLPEYFAPGDAVMDIGAHTGAVSWRCAASGAEVLAVEPCRENFALLAHNLAPVAGRCVCLCAAAWRSDRPPRLLPFQPNWMPLNTGSGCTMGDCPTQKLYDVPGFPLDDLLRMRERWRLLKLDCEGAEFPILYSSCELGRVAEVALEYHHRSVCQPFADAGPCDVGTLKEWLELQGFAVAVEGKGEGMGLLFARRPG